ncbi:MAG: serine--tRNA ligase, partial [Candidatus Puniceispirillaceae bacterium]
MHDIKFIREHPDRFDLALKRRGIAPLAEEIVALDKARRDVQSALQDKQSRRNDASRQIGQIKAQGGDADAIMREVAQLKTDIPALEAQDAELEAQLHEHLISLPNMLDDVVPDGEDETQNELVREVGEKPQFSFTPKDHVDIGEALGGMDFPLAAKLSGARFVVLKGQLARLERALAAFMLDVHTQEHGYLEILPPALVTTQTMTGTGQLPKFAEDLFRTSDDRWLIPTAEVPLTNFA